MTLNLLDKDVWIRVTKTFVAAFLGVWGLPAILGTITGSQPLDVGVLRAAASAGIVAALTYLWNLYLVGTGRQGKFL